MKKYVRIQARYSGKTGKPVGIFAACYLTLNSKYHEFNASDEDKLLYKKIADWFESNLPNPPFYQEGNPNKYITWFKTDSSALMIDKLKSLMSILDKYKVAHDVIYTDYVGNIVYEDEFQVAVE